MKEKGGSYLMGQRWRERRAMAFTETKYLKEGMMEGEVGGLW